jgi:hypothetical protein
VTRAAGAVSGLLTSAQDEGSRVTALQAKVKSGTQLTPQEDAMARKYGMKA